jgi:hypothetical protein
MADWAGCSPGLIQSIETGRRRLSTEIALRISNSTGVDATWLMSNDSDAPMINSAGGPYDYHKDFKPRESAKGVSPLVTALHRRWRELQLAVAFDLLHRLLTASRVKGKDSMNGFMDRLAKFLEKEVNSHANLKKTIKNEHRRTDMAAFKAGALSLLAAADFKPLQRGMIRLDWLLNEFGARKPHQSRRRRRSVKS